MSKKMSRNASSRANRFGLGSMCLILSYVFVAAAVTATTSCFVKVSVTCCKATFSDGPIYDRPCGGDNCPDFIPLGGSPQMDDVTGATSGVPGQVTFVVKYLPGFDPNTCTWSPSTCTNGVCTMGTSPTTNTAGCPSFTPSGAACVGT